jgi:hypothetical protein
MQHAAHNTQRNMQCNMQHTIRNATCNPAPLRRTHACTHAGIGNIHSRVKQPVGRRLALGALALAYNYTGGAYAGPRLVGCSVGRAVLTLRFDAALLGAEKLALANPVGLDVLAAGREWRAVALARVVDGASVEADLPSDVDPAAVLAVRYAWLDNPCCAAAYGGSAASRAGNYTCVPGSCALYTLQSALPAAPFLRQLANLQCV